MEVGVGGFTEKGVGYGKSVFGSTFKDAATL